MAMVTALFLQVLWMDQQHVKAPEEIWGLLGLAKEETIRNKNFSVNLFGFSEERHAFQVHFH